ncbi:gamma-glutamylcyclotransferase family protein [Halospeciosus flavus]|uniref:Gamma-glutamylcyclotransferase n=1 Tax=Halospeciosus flavus TaxID=3032283 RepID=A0ABD5Z886_9EURY|nr:gamma-glutamylcyclotransferase family protein [Halospeciosus flavus]
MQETFFAYGTLTDPATADAVLTEFEYAGAATLVGMAVDESGEHPTLVPGGRTEGRLLHTAEVESLDEYEGVARGLYRRVSVPLDREGDGDVQVYVGDPVMLGVDGVAWPGTGPLRERVERYVDEEDVRVV